MKLKFIAIAAIIVLILPVLALGAGSEKAPIITEATFRGNVLEISGEIEGGLKGMEVGLVVYDNNGNIVHIDQTVTQSFRGTRKAVNFSFLRANMSDSGRGYKAVVSAKGCSKYETEIEYIDTMEFYVSPDGAVGADGSFENPFATLGEARDAVRAYKAANGGKLPMDVVVYLRGGEYISKTSFVLTGEDSGNNGHTVSYRAYPGEMPKFIATFGAITNWTEDNGVWKAKAQSTNILGLYDSNTRIGSIARHPNSGYARSSIVSVSDASATTWQERYADDIPEFTVPEKDYNFFVSLWPSIQGDDNWYETVEPVKVIEKNNGVYTFSLYSTGSYKIAALSRYYLMGAPEFLDAEGEFHVDRSTLEISFIPPADFEMSSDTVLFGSASFPIISINGTEENPVSFVNVSGLEIMGTNRLHSAVKIENSSDIKISGMYIHDVYDSGISASGIVSRVEIFGNRLDNIGKNGITISAKTNNGEIKGSYCKDNKVYNNHISNVGRFIGSSAGVWVWSCEDTLISNNLIHGSRRAGIELNTATHLDDMIGKTIEGTLVTSENAHEFVPTRGNTIEYNDVYDCMSDSEDGGSIYMVAHDNIIRYNHVHDVTGTLPGGIVGIYLDDGSSYNEVYGNAVYNLRCSSTQDRYSVVGYNIRGNYNTLTNNIAAKLATNGGYAYRYDYANNYMTSNIAYNCDGRAVYITNNTMLASCDGNIYYESASSPKFYIGSAAYSFANWQNQGFDQNGKIADPGFIDAENDDFRFKDDNGFETVYSQNIGVTPDYPYAEDADYKKLYVRVEGVETNPGLISAGEDKPIKLSVFARNTKGYAVDNVNADFVSHNEDMVTVSSGGTLSIVGRGKARVTVTAGGVSTDIYIHATGAGIWFEDANGNYISSISQSLSSVTAVADPGDMDTKGAVLIIAVYNGDEFELAIEQDTIENGRFQLGLNLQSLGTYDKIKAFFWKKDSLYPIFRNKIITKE